MISEKIENMLNEQFNRELYSANLYLSICSYFETQDLDGFAHFFRLQAQEELDHAMKQFDYVHRVDGRILMRAVEQPQHDFESIMNAFQVTLDHEREITQHINTLAKTALEVGDLATYTFLQWFIQEQVEEEENVRNIIGKLKLAGGNTSTLYLLNEELSKRTPEPGSGTELTAGA